MSFNHPYFIFWAWHGTSHPWIWHHQDYMVLCFLHYSGSFEQINKNIKTLGKNDGNYCSVSCHLHPDSSVLKWMQILFQPENLSEFFWILAASEFTHPLFCINLIELHRGEKTSSSWGRRNSDLHLNYRSVMLVLLILLKVNIHFWTKATAILCLWGGLLSLGGNLPLLTGTGKRQQIFSRSWRAGDPVPAYPAWYRSIFLTSVS